MFTTFRKQKFFIMSEENEDGQLALSIRELNIKEHGKELDNYKKKMQLYILKSLRQTEVGPCEG